MGDTNDVDDVDDVDDNPYPRWAYLGTANGLVIGHEIGLFNLREVAPGFHLGAAAAIIGREDWALVVDFDGLSRDAVNRGAYPKAAHVEVLQFTDGRSFPPGHLDRALALLNEYREHHWRGPILFHCAAGMSRSPSAAYAMLRVAYDLPHEEALRRIQVPNGDGYPLARTLNSAIEWVRGKGR